MSNVVAAATYKEAIAAREPWEMRLAATTRLVQALAGRREVFPVLSFILDHEVACGIAADDGDARLEDVLADEILSANQNDMDARRRHCEIVRNWGSWTFMTHARAVRGAMIRTDDATAQCGCGL